MYKYENYQSKKVKKNPKPVDSNHQSSHLGFFFLLACISSSTVLYIIYYLTFQQFFLISRSKRDKLQELKFLALMLYSVHVYKYESYLPYDTTIYSLEHSPRLRTAVPLLPRQSWIYLPQQGNLLSLRFIERKIYRLVSDMT